VNDFLTVGLSNALAAAVLALIAAAVGAFCRRPALSHALWLLVLAKLVTPPLVRIPVGWPAAPEATKSEASPTITEPRRAILSLDQEEPVAVLLLPSAPKEEPAASGPALPADLVSDPPAPVASASLPWPQVALAVWLAGSLGWFALALVRLGRFHRLLRHARPAPARLRERTRTLSHRLGLNRAPEVRSLPGRMAPMLWAVGGKPLLLVPAELFDRLGNEQLDTLLLHELAHWRRRDHWVRALEFVVLGLYWWNPVVWYARRELREAEEQCCDAWVVSTLPGTGRTYASALLDTLDFLSSAPAAVPPLASGLGQVSDLKRRLTMIMRGTTPRALSWPGCLAVLAVGALFLPLLPALHAQTPGKEAPREDVIVIQVDEEAQVADLEKAKAGLAQQERELKQLMSAVVQAQVNLEAAKARLRESQAKLEAARRGQVKARIDKEIILEHKKGVIVGDKVKNPAGVGEGERKGIIRIEIIASPEMKSDEVKEILKKLESILPKEHAAIHLRVAEEATRNQLRVYPVTEPVIRYVPQIKIGSDKEKPLTVEKKPAGSTQEKRINELEMKLEKVLKELHELRKQMKDSQSGQAPAPFAYTIPAPRANPPLYRIVPRTEVRPGAKNPRPVPPPPVDPYDAPTVPLAPDKPSER
jgi:beta-lactamase regulating signal transducer with metallopeptidase domain